MARGRDAACSLRRAISDLLRSEASEPARRASVERCLLSARDAEMPLPGCGFHRGNIFRRYVTSGWSTRVGIMNRRTRMVPAESISTTCVCG